MSRSAVGTIDIAADDPGLDDALVRASARDLALSLITRDSAITESRHVRAIW